MIILMDGNVWEKLVEFGQHGRSGTLIMERHFMDDAVEHWACDLSGKLLGKVELNFVLHTDINRIKVKHVKAAGFGSKEFLKRRLAAYLGCSAREIKSITVAEIRVTTVISLAENIFKESIVGQQTVKAITGESWLS